MRSKVNFNHVDTKQRGYTMLNQIEEGLKKELLRTQHELNSVKKFVTSTAFLIIELADKKLAFEHLSILEKHEEILHKRLRRFEHLSINKREI